MRFTSTIQFLFLVLLVQACASKSPDDKTSGLAGKFKNTLDLSGIPERPNDRSVYSFSDLGAWHSYSLSPTPSGGFVGPFLMTDDNGLWAARQLVSLDISINKEPLDLSKARILESSYMPGQLFQSYQIEDVTVNQRLIFISDRSTLVQYEIVSQRKQPMIGASLRGKTWLEGWSFDQQNDGLILTSDRSKTKVAITFENNFEGRVNGYSFHSKEKEINLNANFPVTLCYVQSAWFTEAEEKNDREIIEKVIANPKWAFATNKKRWNGYLTATLTKRNGTAIDTAYSRLAVKSLNTLINNWRSAAGELKHDGLFPSYAYGGFHGFWAWDSWKHAVGLAEIMPDLAREQIWSMYDFQDVDGMIADCIFRDTLIEKHNWRDTKPPLSGWAIAKVFEATQDTAFVRKIYPKLKKYHQWWYKFRDHDGNGLCEYGSTDGSRVAAAWESGMDNAVRFDEATMLTNPNGGFSLDQESVDLNAYLYAEKMYIAKLAGVLKKQEEASRFKSEAARLATDIRQKFYNPQKGYYFDVMLDDKMIEIYGPEGWIPLWTGIASDEQAGQLAKQMTSEEKFNTLVPLPTLDASHPKFNPKNGYWRGPVWLDQVYFGIKGLEKYGFQAEADLLRNKLMQNAEGLLSNAPIRENYHPISGEGLNAKHFSWSAAHLLMLIRE